MAKQHEMDTSDDLPAGISRRKFIQGVIVASAATSVAGLPTASATLPSAPPTTVLTAEQSGVLTTVLNRLIPADGVMPGAGDVGMARFIDRALGAAPHLRHHFVGVLAALPDEEAIAQLSDAQVDDLLHRIEQQQNESFDLLLQATYTGYYSNPQVLAALGAESDQAGHLLLDRFDLKLLEDVQRRGPISTDV